MARNVKWRGKAVAEKVKRGMSRNILMAAEMLASDIRRAFPISGAKGTRGGGGSNSNHSAAEGIPYVQTAHLKRNIGVEKRGISSARVGTGIGSKDSVGYALWLEKGTRNMAARPFLVPSLKRNKKSINSIVGRKVI